MTDNVIYLHDYQRFHYNRSTVDKFPNDHLADVINMSRFFEDLKKENAIKKLNRRYLSFLNPNDNND